MSSDFCIPSLTSLSMYLREINSIPVLTLEEEKALGYRIQNGDANAINELVMHNLKYVVSVAHSFKMFGLPLEDLIEDGNIGLILAAWRFDPSKGDHFSVYARSYIVREMEYGIARAGHNINLPYRINEEVILYHKKKGEFKQKLDYEPTLEEIAEALNIPVERAKYLEDISKPFLSLNYLISEGESTEFGSFISSSHTTLEEDYFKKSLHEEIRKVFEILNITELDVELLTAHFGLDEEEPQSFRTIAEKYDRTGAWAQQRVKKVLTKIRNCKYFSDAF